MQGDWHDRGSLSGGERITGIKIFGSFYEVVFSDASM